MKNLLKVFNQFLIFPLCMTLFCSTQVILKGNVIHNTSPRNYLSNQQQQSKFVRKLTSVFTRTREGNYYYDEFSIIITDKKIFYEKKGSKKEWEIKHLGNVIFEDFGQDIVFNKLFIVSQKENVYISHQKVASYKGVLYYIMLIGDQIMYLR